MKSEKTKMGQGPAWRLATRGFTLIELLIVIALIGILAVALLSAINPLEQLRKGRDSARKADASELLNSIERFYASYQCYPWSWNSTGGCQATPADLGGPTNPDFGSGNAADGGVEGLLTTNELKTQFRERIESSGNPSLNRLYLLETGNTGAVAGQVSVCYEPESSTGRGGGLGRITSINGGTGDCTGQYSGGLSLNGSANCTICIPQ